MQTSLQIHRHPDTIPGLDQGSTVMIGNFDGVHLGHQAILRHGMAGPYPLVLMTFEPHPKEFFHPDGAPPRLSSLREKAIMLRELGLRHLLCLPFRSSLAGLSPETFVETLLQQGLNARRILVGHDFRFGAKRQGDTALLEKLGQAGHFTVETMPPVCLDDERISSTGLRQILQAGRLSEAERCLGRPYFMCGRVVHGDKRGRQLGFPTANIRLGQRKPPLRGVFAVRVDIEGGATHPGVANLGTRPTVDGLRTLLEIHILDHNPDLYGKRLLVHFLYKVRDEKRFTGLEALKTQISQDADEARRWLSQQESKIRHGL